MFRPNQTCVITPVTGMNVFSEETLGTPFQEGCAVTDLESAAKATNTRAELSGSGSAAEDLMITAAFMLTAKTAATLGDMITVHGEDLRIVSLLPQWNTRGNLDHYVAGAGPWA
jgi:hypothetical protein